MDTDAVCWMCFLRLAPGDRVTRLSSLRFEVHARCADTVLRDEPSTEEDLDDIPE